MSKSSRAASNNRSNQMNRNNAAYHSSGQGHCPSSESAGSDTRSSAGRVERADCVPSVDATKE
jgi:hypothetical protein